MSLIQLQQQRAVTEQAYRQGYINQAQYNQWLANWNQQYEAAKAQQAQTQSYQRADVAAKTQQAAQASTVIQRNQPQTVSYTAYERKEIVSNALAKQIAVENPQLLKQLPKDSLITAYDSKTQVVHYFTPEQTQELKRSVEFYKEASVSSGQDLTRFMGVYAAPTGIAASQVADVREVTSSDGQNTLQFTLKPSPPNDLEKIIAAKEAEREADISNLFKAPQRGLLTIKEGKVAPATPSKWDVTKLELLGAGVAAPFMGAAATVKSAVIGLGVGQAVESGSTVLQGRDIRESLLTPRAALSAMAGGVMFSGAASGINQVFRFAPNTVRGVAGRIAVSTGLGAGGGAAYEFLETGRVTERGVGEGAVFGFGFGVVGEAAGPLASRVAGKVSGAAKNDLVMQKAVIPAVQKFVGSGPVQSIVKGASAFKENVLGIQFFELSGAKEVFVQKTSGRMFDMTRVTEPTVKTVTLRGAEARYYKQYNLEKMKNPVIELEGSQRLKVLQKDAAGIAEEVTIYPKPPTQMPSKPTRFDLVGDVNREFPGAIEAVKYKPVELPTRDPTVISGVRSAKPFLEAVKGGAGFYQKVSATEEVSLSVTRGRIYAEKPRLGLGLDKPLVVLEKKAVVKEGEILPELQSAYREFRVVKVYDKPTKVNVARKTAGKLVDVPESAELYERVTGKIIEPTVKSDVPPLITYEQVKILKEQSRIKGIWDKAIVDKVAFVKREAGDFSGAMKPGTNEFFRKALASESKGVGVKAVSKQVEVSKTVEAEVLPRAIIGEVKASAKHVGLFANVKQDGSVKQSKRERAAVASTLDAAGVVTRGGVSNPFAFRGRPYYRRRQSQTADEYELQYYSYPSVERVKSAKLIEAIETPSVDIRGAGFVTRQDGLVLSRQESMLGERSHKASRSSIRQDPIVSQVQRQPEALWVGEYPKQTTNDVYTRTTPFFGGGKHLGLSFSPFDAKFDRGGGGSFGGKKHGVRSYWYENPLMEGEDLLGL